MGGIASPDLRCRTRRQFGLAWGKGFGSWSKDSAITEVSILA